MDWKALFEAIRKELMVKKRYSYRQLAEIANVSNATIGDWLVKQEYKPFRRPNGFIKLVEMSKVNLDNFADHKSVGGRVELLRWKNKLSVAEFAKKIGRSITLVSSIERGEERKHCITTIEKIAEVLNTTTDYILHGEIEVKKPVQNGLVDLPKVEPVTLPEKTGRGGARVGSGKKPSGNESVTVRVDKRILGEVNVLKEKLAANSAIEVEPEVVEYEPNFTIPPENEIVKNPKVMLSTEIAALTGKRHNHVIRDIENIIQKLIDSLNPNLGLGFKSMAYKDVTGKSNKCYELDYEATMIVMTGYDVVARAKVIKRWQELEELAKLIKTPQIEQPTAQLFVPSLDGDLPDNVCDEFKRALKNASRCGFKDTRAEQYANEKVKNIYRIDVLKTLVGI